MPAALDVNWEAIRTLAVAVGMKAASDQTGISYGAIRQRSSTEGWFKYSDSLAKAVTKPKADPSKSRSDQIVTAPEAMQSLMVGLSGKTKLSLAVTAAKLSQHFEEQPAADLVSQTPAIKDTATIAEKAHGWNKPDQAQSLIQVNISTGEHGAAPVVELD